MMGPGGQGGQSMQMSDMPLNIVDISRGLVSLNTNNSLKLSKVQKEKVLTILRKVDASLAKTENNSALMEKIFTKDQLDYIKARRTYGMQGINVAFVTPDQIKQGVDPIILAAIKSLKEKAQKNQPGSNPGGVQQPGGYQQPGGAQSGPGQQKPQ